MSALKKSCMSAIVAQFCIIALPAFAADQSPWVHEAGSGEVVVGYGEQTADRFFAGNTDASLPTDLELQTLFVGASYGITERLTIDAQFAYSESDFLVVPGLAPRGGLSGIADSKIGLRYSLYNDNGAAVALKGALIIEGDYDTGAITAIGDGGSGIEVAVLAGKAFESGFAINGELGYRKRGNDVPDELFASGAGSYSFNDNFGIYLGYQLVRSDGDLDIGAPGFSPARFPEVDEDYDIAQGGFSIGFGPNWSGSLGYGRKLDGRNTAKSDFWNAAVVYTF